MAVDKPFVVAFGIQLFSTSISYGSMGAQSARKERTNCFF